MRPTRLFLAALALTATALLTIDAATADDVLKERKYYFGTHEARTNITFVSEADLETIHGVTNKIWGEITIDKTGKKASGSIRAGVAALKTGIDLRDEHLRSSDWLDAKKYPWIRLTLVTATENKDGKTWDIAADLTIKKTTKRVTVKAKVRVIPDKIGKALGDGSWMRVQTSFDVKLSDYDITIPEKIGSKVSETWKIGIDLYGTTVNPHAKKKSGS